MYLILLLLPIGLAHLFTIMVLPIAGDPQLRMGLIGLIENPKIVDLPRAKYAIDPLALRIY